VRARRYPGPGAGPVHVAAGSATLGSGAAWSRSPAMTAGRRGTGPGP